MVGPSTYFDLADIDRLDPTTADLVRRRQRSLGGAYRLFYREPLQAVRAHGVTIWDVDGRAYLDAYNNVPSVGHSHPRVASAVFSALTTINTHTRYLDAGLITYSERLLASMPGHLEHVIYSCTGSEANDLAVRIAKQATGRSGVIVTDYAYHGVTTEISSISPSLGGIETVAPWVRTVPAPSAYRAGVGPAEVGARFARHVAEAISSLEQAGYGTAALIVDTIFASDGVLPDPAGFLAAAVSLVHAAGGLVIADEVQPGFGRLGEGLWGFDRHGIAPDIVTLGKPMGNGLPISATVTRAELIDAFGARSRYFNTFGGTPASIAAATAVLDIIADEGLIENAQQVGQHLLTGLTDLARRHPLIGDVRGTGLFVGVELVVDRADRMPASDLTLQLVNAMRDAGVLLATAGPDNNILKIRPPLPFARSDADRLVEALDASLTELE